MAIIVKELLNFLNHGRNHNSSIPFNPPKNINFKTHKLINEKARFTKN